jgi:dethiobiotin synthetase/adenosylmethionine--8-amino-7-oxononanoate aminotransferase
MKRWRRFGGRLLSTPWWIAKQVTVIDGRYGEDFAIYGQDPKGGDGSISLRFDGAASWWTQGLSPELQQELVQTATYAAGRYGHVMFPENVHEPAAEATTALLEGPGRGWASRVFYSDNGSTATEVGLKMAFRKYYVDAGLVSKGWQSTSERFGEQGRR